MAPQASGHRVKKPKAKWSMTVMMNARDLSRDDDFLSHLLVEHLGTDDSPLQVHKMDPSRRLPKHEPADVLAIVRKYVVRKGGTSTSASRVKRAVDALLELTAVKQYLHKRSTSQINAFATHASRYFELYLPTGSIEISHTSRYSHRTGKSELCILATTPLKVGQVISDLKGSLAHLTVEEDEELKKTDSRRRDGGIRRDFSVIHSNQKNKSHLFLGPARFVNHDCDHNVELFRDGRVITFRVIKPIAAGQEVTAHYGEGYFGKGNRHCLCQTCERRGKGGYTPQNVNSDPEVEDDSSTDEETREERIKTGLGLTAKGNPNERRTRRGVYAILPEEDTDDEDRVGATETVAAQTPAQQVEPANGKSASAVADSSLSSNSTPLSTPATLPPISSTTDNSLKLHDRRTSVNTSELASLPDSQKAATRASHPASNPVNGLLGLTSTSSLSSLSSAASGGTPTRVPAQDNAALDSTPATSRMSTRSSTASQSKGTSKDESSPPRASQAKTGPQIDKRTLRSSRSMAALTEKDKEKPKELEAGVRANRQSRQSVPSASTRGSEAGPPDATKSTSAVIAKIPPGKSQSKSATPAITASSSGSAAVKPARSGVPCCGTCSSEMPQLIGIKRHKNAVNTCPRCKRHVAIFGSPWPNRNPAFETHSSESSESSSGEVAFEVIREQLKDIHSHGNKIKYGRKYVEIKHPDMERPIKRRKTESSLFYSAKVKTDAHHQSRSASGPFDGHGKSVKREAYLGHAFSGSVQRSRAHRALSRERVRSGGSVTASPGVKRSWDNLGDLGQKALGGIRPRAREGFASRSTFSISGFRRTIRRFPSMPSLQVAKPLAALCARPSPNMFARNSWAASKLGDGDGDTADVDSLMDVSSELTDLPDAEPKSISQVGQKRKREPSQPSDTKPKKGKSFYMKDGKAMPKGWVLVTSSSSETEGDEGDEEQDHQQNEPRKTNTSLHVVSGNSKGRTTEGAFYSTTGADSTSASTPSLAHTPSSRATSTPTQSSGTLVDERPSVAPAAGKQAVTTYSLRRSTATRTPSTVQSTKRRKIDKVEASPSLTKTQATHVDKYQDSTPTFKAPQHSGASGQGDLTPPNDTPESGSPDDGSEVVELPAEEISIIESAPIAMLQASFSADSGNVTKAEHISVLPRDPDEPVSSGVGLAGSDAKRIALEVSNLIHGTAFSYGHPDARTTWKPTYHFSELDGWDSDVETCL